MKNFSALLVLLSALLAGCVTMTPSTAVHQPMTVRPEARTAIAPANGSIYNVANSRPLFEDRRARFIGDTITINIAEMTAAAKKSDTKAERTDTHRSSGITTLKKKDDSFMSESRGRWKHFTSAKHGSVSGTAT